MAVPDDFRAQSRKNWSAQAEGWEGRREALRTSTMPVSAWMIDSIDPQPGQTLLELAAGTGDTGLLAAELIAPTGTLISSDFSPEMLQVAQRRAEELGITNVRFKQIDAETSVDLEAASVDGALCRWAYMLMADPENALRETRRVLKPGRRLALAAWAEPEANPWSVLPRLALEERGLKLEPTPGAPHQFSWARREDIAAALEAAGFTEHAIEPLDFSYDYRSAADWWQTQLDLSARFNALAARASDDDLAAAGERLDREAEAFASDEGVLRIPARTWVAWAAA